MGVSVRIEPAGQAHALAVALHIRAGDAAEIAALGREPVPALIDAIAASRCAYCALFDGEPVALFGVVPYPDATERGNAWLITAAGIERDKRAFLRGSRTVLEFFLREFEYLDCLVDGRYRGALRWAAWLGFEVSPGPVSEAGVPFHRISIRRS